MSLLFVRMPIRVPKKKKKKRNYREHQWGVDQRPSEGNNLKVRELGNFTYLKKVMTWCFYRGVELTKIP